MITKQDMQALELLSKRPMAAPTMDDDLIVRIQRLVSQGLARDNSAFHGTRIPVRLRIWTINDRGRAILEQKGLTETNGPRQLTLTHKGI